MTSQFQDAVNPLLSVSKPEDIYKILCELRHGICMAVGAYFSQYSKDFPRWLVSAVQFGKEDQIPQDAEEENIWAVLRAETVEMMQKRRIELKQLNDARSAVLFKYHQAEERKDELEAKWCWAEVLFPRNPDGTPMDGATVSIPIGNSTSREVTWEQIQRRDAKALRFIDLRRPDGTLMTLEQWKAANP